MKKFIDGKYVNVAPEPTNMVEPAAPVVNETPEPVAEVPADVPAPAEPGLPEEAAEDMVREGAPVAADEPAPVEALPAAGKNKNRKNKA